jgi:hypothetical protein
MLISHRADFRAREIMKKRMATRNKRKSLRRHNDT